MDCIVGFGDSVTFGHGLVSKEENFLFKLAQKYGYKTINSSVGGNTTSDAIKRLQSDLLDLKPSVAIIEFGMNDHVCDDVNQPKVDLATYKTNLETMIDQLKAHGCNKIILCTIHPIILNSYYSRHPEDYYRDPKGADRWIDNYSLIVKEVAWAKGVLVSDINKHFSNYIDRGGKLTDLLLEDGVHPNARGHEHYYQCIDQELRKLVKH